MICRCFASLYVTMRFLHPLLFTLLGVRLFKVPACLVTVLLMALVIKFQPYKCKRSNYIDTIFLLILICGYQAYVETLLIQVLHQDWMFSHTSLRTLAGIFSVLPPLYASLLLITKIPAQNCYERIKRFLFQLRNKTKSRENLLLKWSGRSPNYHTFY